MEKTSHQNQWDEIAWNGIAFYKPASWEIATIGRNYMMIGTHAHPRMEITWGSSQKRVSRRQDIKKLQSRIRKQHLTTVDSWTPSGAWLKALSSYETSGFSWKNPERTGYGLILTCLSCQRVSLIQFFQNIDEPDYLHDAAPRVLSSFMDHANGSDQRWAVFDVRATLPTDFQIKSYQFSPGFMEMGFSSLGQQIRFYRWSPAAVLLSGKKLSDFAESLMHYPDGSSKKTLGADRIEWEYSPSLGLWTRFAAFLPGKFCHHRMLIRHDPDNNRILAIKAECRQSMDSSRLDRIFSSYEITAA
ncbi:MAG: hypothetical protein Q7U40_15810 [Desulfatirhabdiaceae bacterium]|nr:hypothetical protein [Desulfatirhabdiaceae bacterium]